MKHTHFQSAERTEQENIEMPRIPHVGEFDWKFPEMTKSGQLGTTDHLCLLFHFDIDDWKSEGGESGESVGYLNGRCANPRRCNCINPVFPDTETHIMPQIAKTIGLLISEQDWTKGVIVSCLPLCDRQISFLVASDFSMNNPVEHPTRFIESVIRKIVKDLKRQKS